MPSHFEAARGTLARLLHADPTSIALTRNATESMNLVARGLTFTRDDEVILTSHEHPGGAAPWVAVAQECGLHLRHYEPTGDPTRDAEQIWALYNKRTRAVVVSHVLATTGAVMPVREIAATARARGVWTVIDGAQAAGIVPLDLADLGADCYLASGHKWLLGPVETGFLHVRPESGGEFHVDILPAPWWRPFGLVVRAADSGAALGQHRKDVVIRSRGPRR